MPQPSLRKCISDLRISSGDVQHVGLWLNRMLPAQLKDGESPQTNSLHPHTALINQAHTIREPEEYYHFIERWQSILGSLGAKPRKATVRGRMSVGLGAESVLETGVTLHHTYGVPYIPGSALKGLAAAYAHRFLADDRWRKEVRGKTGTLIAPIGDAHKIMFGDTTSAGYVTFFDALYVSQSGHESKALWPDVITVHHPDYYQEKKQGEKLNEQLIPPADWDSPTPVSFVSATGTYLIALTGPSAWVTAAFDILALALDEMGIGGKTSSGYGRMTLDGLDDARERWSGKTVKADSGTAKDMPQTDHEQQAIEPLLAQIRKLPSSRVANEINRFYLQWKTATVREELRQQIALSIIEKVCEAKREAQSSGKAWYQELLASTSRPEQT